jgi:hypothetical protein
VAAVSGLSRYSDDAARPPRVETPSVRAEKKNRPSLRCFSKNGSPGAASSPGEISVLYDAMRISGSVASVEIAAAAMRDKGLDPENDPVTRTDFGRRVTLQMNDLCRKGKVEKIGRGPGMRRKLAGRN